VTINTNVNPGIASNSSASKGSFVLAALFGFGFFGFAFRKKTSRWGALLTVVCLLLCGGAIAGLSACSTTTLGSANATGVTPAGNYWVTITAKETGSMPVYTNYGTPSVETFVQGNGDDVSLPFTLNVNVN
jgi:hypothetical protein